ncbi:FAD binding domain-containing protein, partial [Echria macrotheca]
LLQEPNLASILHFPNTTSYTETITSYYAANVQDIKPACILKPLTTQHVSLAIRTLNRRGARDMSIAIRSGGHAPSLASNNVADGVVIDLGGLDSVTFNLGNNNNKPGPPPPPPPPGSISGGGVVSIGAGARWGHVYSVLEAQGVMVPGAREGHVGVGGLLLGGGFSWYSGKVGMCADNVVAYEVVLAGGDVVVATAEGRYKDLFRALKGGLNNLGVVTRFDVKSFEARDVYGGIVVFPWAQRDVVAGRLVEMVERNGREKAEGGFLSLAWSPGTGMPPNVVLISANVDGDANSTSFRDLGALGPLVDLRGSMPLSALTSQIAGALGLYNVWYTLSFHNTLDMAAKVTSVFGALVADLEGLQIDEAVQVIFVLTPLPKGYGSRENILGLEKMARNSLVLQTEIILPTARYQALLKEKLRAATDEIEAYAKATGQDTPFRYVNYANPEQNPLGSYGRENSKFLARTAKKVDPEGFFQDKVVGTFKLAGL